jgi:hypothetical protein
MHTTKYATLVKAKYAKPSLKLITTPNLPSLDKTHRNLR